MTGNPPLAGQLIAVRVPDFLGQLLALWQNEQLAASCLAWFSEAPVTDHGIGSSPLQADHFPHLRRRQREAFELCRYDRGFLIAPPGTGKTATLGCLLAGYLVQFPGSRVLLLSSTNTAVDQALTATDASLQWLGRSGAGMDEVRNRCKRVGLHFIPSNYQGREHLLFARSEPIAELTELEANRPDSTDDRAYASWRDAVESIRRRIREKTRHELSRNDLHAMTTTRAAFDFEMLRSFSYDLAVFDEASQVGLAHALMLAQLAKRVLFRCA